MPGRPPRAIITNRTVGAGRSTFRFVPNPQMIVEVDTSAELGRTVGKTADRVAQRARALAPRRTGTFARSIRSLPSSLRGRQWVGRVVTSDPFWHLEEFGSVNNPPHRTFARATVAVGLDYVDERGPA